MTLALATFLITLATTLVAGSLLLKTWATRIELLEAQIEVLHGEVISLLETPAQKAEDAAK